MFPDFSDHTPSNARIIARFNAAAHWLQSKPGNAVMQRELILTYNEAERRGLVAPVVERVIFTEYNNLQPGEPGWWETCKEVEF